MFVLTLAYKQEQRGRREAAADRKKRVQVSSTSGEGLKVATENIVLDTAMDIAPVASEDRPAVSELSASSIP